MAIVRDVLREDIENNQDLPVILDERFLPLIHQQIQGNLTNVEKYGRDLRLPLFQKEQDSVGVGIVHNRFPYHSCQADNATRLETLLVVPRNMHVGYIVPAYVLSNDHARMGIRRMAVVW